MNGCGCGCGFVITSYSIHYTKLYDSMYNTAIFEFKDVGIRNVLNHIQKDEQEHGQQIYNYMSQNGMY